MIGTAGWTLPLGVREQFGAGASQLERYATRLGCVEINSSFYRPHRRATYERWAAAVPDAFRFSVKVPRDITHVRRLRDAADLIDQFVRETDGLGEKRGAILVQLPPSLTFDAIVARAFLEDLSSRSASLIACEPRHATWFPEDADELLSALGVARVAADPAAVPRAATPGGATKVAYLRWHGSPVTYASAYDGEMLDRAATLLRTYGPGSWCIFDNTQFGEATRNALDLADLLA